MSLGSPHRSRERILIYGEGGSGKSTAYLNIARWSQLTRSPAQFHVADLEVGAIERMLEEGYPSLTNVHVSPIQDWPELRDWNNDTRKIVSPDDWMIVDDITTPWDFVLPTFFIDEIFQQEIDEYFLAARKAMVGTDDKTLRPFDGFVDYNVINKLYRTFEVNLTLKAGCHVLVTAGPKELVTKGKFLDDKDIISDFERFGFKPKGQKDLPRRYHTTLYSQRQKSHYVLNTVKDREREEMSGLRITKEAGFAKQYLVNIGGWHL